MTNENAEKEYVRDKYDVAYDKGYAAGLEDRPFRPPSDDTSVNYQDGYTDGSFERRQATMA